MPYQKHLNSEIRTGRHCTFNMHIHLVFITKYRKKVFQRHHISALNDIFKSICEKFESTLEECNGEEDHIHLLISYPPKVSVSRLVNNLKTVSSRMLRQKFSDIADRYYNKNVLWTPSYFAASCGGGPLSIIKQYIQSQQITNSKSC